MEARTSSVRVEVHAPICAAAAEMLTPDALRFVGYLCHKFEDRRRTLLSARESRALEFDSGAVPTFCPHDDDDDDDDDGVRVRHPKTAATSVRNTGNC